MSAIDYGQKVDQTLESISDSDEISDHNAKLIKDYHRDRTLDGIGDATQQKNLAYLKKIAEYAGDDKLDELDRDDMKNVIQWVQSRDLADSTINTYKEITKLFWKWVHDIDDDEELPDVISWIQKNGTNTNRTLPKDLLTKEEIDQQIEAAYNPRDKALISMLYETGARIGEIIDLTVGDIDDRRHGKKVVLDGKTGSRRVPLVESVPHLNTWLNQHPNPEKDAPIWCKIQQGGPDDQLGYRYIREKILKKNMERAGIDKPSNPHHYRHSRASYLANELTESQLCEWFGWSQGSDVPARYVHLSGRDIDNAYNQLHGISEPDDEEEEPDVMECPRCEELNQSSAKFCSRCGFALSREGYQEKDEIDSDIYETKGEVESDEEDTALDKMKTLLRENPQLLNELAED